MRATLAVLLLSSSALAQEAAPPPAQPADQQLPRLAILPLRVEGLTGNEAKRVALVLRARTETRGGYVVQSQDTTDELADSAQALGIECSLLAPACAARFGRVADVAWVITGSATRLGDRVGVELRLVQVSDAALRRRLSLLLPVDPDAQIAAATEAFALFFDDTVELGRVNLSVQPAGANVYVDGAPRGQAPLTLHGLAPGEHEIAVGEEGFEIFRERVVVAAGATVDKKIMLQPGVASLEMPGPVERNVPFVIAGAGALVAVAGVVGAVAGALPALAFADAQARLDALNVDDAAYPTLAQGIRAEQAQAESAWNNNGIYLVYGGAGGVLVGVAAVAAGLTWGGSVLARVAEAEKLTKPGEGDAE